MNRQSCLGLAALFEKISDPGHGVGTPLQVLRACPNSPAPKCGTANHCHRHRPRSNRGFAGEHPRPPEPVREAAIWILRRSLPQNATASREELCRRDRRPVLVPRPQNDAAVEERLSRNESVIDADAGFSVAIDYRVSV
jgi:hypothetical protein